MASNLFGQPSKNDIKVGYIDPQLGYVSDVTICEANEYAEKNPGTTFLFKDGNRVLKYLNINEVNNLSVQELESNQECEGINQKKICGPPSIQFYGGGGIGAQGNPIIGNDGSLLAVDLVRGGNGYQYAPQVSANDHCNYGAGTVLTAVLGETSDQFETYDTEDDFEEYQICDPNDVGFGRRYGPNGEDLGPWEPSNYTRIGGDPIKREIDEYERIVRLTERKPFWSTRKNKPNTIKASDPRVTPTQMYDVTDKTHLDLRIKNGEKNPKAWNEFMNSYAVSPVPPSNVKGSDFASVIFTMEWNQEFPVEGEYIFRGLCDNIAELYLDDEKITNLGSFADSIKDIRKTLKKGVHSIRVELLNSPIKEVAAPTTSTPSTIVNDIKPKFIQKNGRYFLEVSGTGSGEVSFVMEVNDASYIAGVAATEVAIPSDSGKLKFTRKSVAGLFGAGSTYYEKEETIKKSGKFTAGKIYGPIEIIGAVLGAGTPKVSSNKIGLLDADGTDENIKLIIVDAKNTNSQSSKSQQSSSIKVSDVVSSKSWNENPMGVALTIDAPDPPIPKEEVPEQEGRCPNNPFWTTRFPSSSSTWYPVNYPGPRTITETIQTNTPTSTSDKQEVEFTVYGQGAFRDIYFTFTSVDGKDSFNIRGVDKNKKTRVEKIQILKNVNYVVRAKEDSTKYNSVEQGLIKGGSKDKESGTGTSNKIFADYTSSGNDNDDIQITVNSGTFTSSNRRKAKNSSRNTFDLVYKLTATPTVKNTTSSTTRTYDAPGWSKFMNRYAISPVKPLDIPGSDKAGETYSISWDVDIPYDGFYGVKGTRDNLGRILIDSNEVSKLDNFSVESPKLTKIFLTKGRHKITAEVYNQPITSTKTIDQLIFRTRDWQVGGIQNSTNNSSSNIQAKFVQKNGRYFLEVAGSGSGEVSFVMEVNDASYIAGVAATEIIIPSDSKQIKLTRKGNSLIGNAFGLNSYYETEESIKQSGTFTGGKTYGPIQIIGAVLGAGTPRVSSNKIGLLDADGTDENIKLIITDVKQGTQTSTSLTSSTVSSGASKNGITYEGPKLFYYTDSRWGDFMNENSVSPYLPPLDSENSQINGTKKYTWKNVKFPESGQYRIAFQADNIGNLFIGGKKVLTTTDFIGSPPFENVNISQGTYDIVVEVENIKDTRDIFTKNPTGLAVVIRKNITLTSKNEIPWSQNPMGISAILVPPPCPKKISGRGVVVDVNVLDPGNGYTPSSSPSTYPVSLRLKSVIVENPGINYNCGVDEIQITPSNGATLDYECDSYGRIVRVPVVNPGLGFTQYPEIRMVTPDGKVPTGINASFIPQFEVVRDPIVIDSAKLIQVTDLVGLKQNGYVDGRAYYGAVFYKNGVRYAGFYETAGELVQVYDTLQESIDAQVVSEPNAIERSGTDTELSSNNPKLNIPGTPENLI